MNKLTHTLSILTCFVLCALLALPAVHAAKPPTHYAGKVQQILPDEVEPSYTWNNERISLDTGFPIAQYRVDTPVTGETAEAKARQYLSNQSRNLGFKTTELNDLQLHAVRASRAGETVRFHQYLGPVRVYGAEVTVSISPKDEVVFVMNTYKPGADVASLEPILAADVARQLTLDILGVDAPLGWEDSELVVYASSGDTSRLAYRVRMEPTGEPTGSWEALVDAHTGEIFKLADRAAYATGNGSAFNPDPLSTANVTYGTAGYTDGNDGDTPQIVAEIFPVTLRDITLNAGTYSLVGPWAEIGDFESPFKGTFSQASPDYTSTRSPDIFEASNTYYHIDTYMRYMNLDLGLNVQPYQYPGGVQFDAHGLNGGDNSHYLSGSGRVAFGEGGVDDAEDADVVIHELGHGIHDWVTVGGLSQVNGLSEGLGDYFAASYSRFLGNWAPGAPQNNWVFVWDGHNPFWPGRVTNYGATYPGGLIGQIHTDGQIWATCNMKVWDLNGREFTDAAVLEGIAMTNGGSNQQDAAAAVVQAAVNMGFPPTAIDNFVNTYGTCVYNVSAPAPTGVFADGFESGNTSSWTEVTVAPKS